MKLPYLWLFFTERGKTKRIKRRKDKRCEHIVCRRLFLLAVAVLVTPPCNLEWIVLFSDGIFRFHEGKRATMALFGDFFFSRMRRIENVRKINVWQSSPGKIRPLNGSCPKKYVSHLTPRDWWQKLTLKIMIVSTDVWIHTFQRVDMVLEY